MSINAENQSSVSAVLSTTEKTVLVFRSPTFAKSAARCIGDENCTYLQLEQKFPVLEHDIQREFENRILFAILRQFGQRSWLRNWLDFSRTFRKFQVKHPCWARAFRKACEIFWRFRSAISKQLKDIDSVGVFRKFLRPGSRETFPDKPVGVIVFEANVFPASHRRRFLEELNKVLIDYLPILIVAGSVNAEDRQEFLKAGVRFVLFPNFSRQEFDASVLAARAVEKAAIQWSQRKFFREFGATIVVIFLGAWLAAWGARCGGYGKDASEPITCNFVVKTEEKEVAKKKPPSVGSRWSCDLSVDGPLRPTYDKTILSQEMTLWLYNASETAQNFRLEDNFKKMGLCLEGMPLRSSCHLAAGETRPIKLYLEIPAKYEEKKSLDQACVSVKDDHHHTDSLPLPDRVKSRIRNLPKKTRKVPEKSRIWDFLMK